MSNLLNVEMETRSSYMNYDNDIYNTNDVYNSNDNPKTQLNGDYSNSHIFSNELVYQNDRIEEMSRSDIYYITSNLNLFYSRMYNYYFRGGIRNIILNVFLNMSILTTTNLFILYTFSFINWNDIISHCKYNTGSCNSITDYIDYSNYIHPLIIIYMIITSCYSIVYLYTNISKLYYYRYIKKFYNNILNIDTEYLNIINWENILDKIKRVNDTKKVLIERFNSENPEVNQYTVIARLTQYNNILISLVNNNTLFKNTSISRNILFSYYIETIVSKSILNKFIEIKNNNNPYRVKIMDIQWHLMKIIVLDIICMPFILMFMMTYYILKNSRDINNKEGLITNKRWTNYALWTFRTYNEVDSNFNDRILKSNFHMNKYIECYPSKTLHFILYFFRFVLSAFVLFIVIISFIEEKALIDLTYGGFNLLWYLAGLTIATSLLNSFLKSKNFEDTNEEIAMKLVKHLYVLPPKDIINNYNMYKSFIAHYKTNIHNIFYEIISIIISPYILYKCYYSNVVEILEFLNDNTRYNINVGSVDNYSNLNINIDKEQNNADLIRKREKSYIAFKTLYPGWNMASDDLNQYLAELSKYNNEEDDIPSMYASEMFSSRTL